MFPAGKIGCGMAKNKFQSPQARELADYINSQYGRAAEYLWERSPDDAIFRRGDNGKWFAGIFHVRQNKIEPDAGAAKIEILDIRCAPDVIDFIVDKKQIFPGWHMNKQHWITIPLDGRMDIAQIYNLVDNSYQLAYGKQ